MAIYSGFIGAEFEKEYIKPVIGWTIKEKDNKRQFEFKHFPP